VRSDSRIYLAGHTGLVGSALVRALRAAGHTDLVVRTRDELDLTDQAAVERFFAAERPEVVLLAAARVGGILANDSYPADFIRDNLLIQQNVICAAHRAGASKLLFLGSSCIYPREAAQPMREDALLSGPLEPTNQWYAIAKIAGIKLCQAYRRQHGFAAISVMPTNLYGPHDNFHPTTSHVLPALLRRLHEAREAGSPEVVVWGTGAPRRELLHVDDLAEACLHLLRCYDGEDIVNIGTGTDLTIRELAGVIAEVVGYRGALRFDPSRPDGAPRKLLDVSRMAALGWRARIPLRAGIEQTYRWYLDHPGARA
jgi:GDP-L-fucose synthase